MNILRFKQQAQGWHFRCSDSPDTSGMNAAAVAQADMSKEQLAWAKDIFAQTAPDRAKATANANAVSEAQLAAMKKQAALTDDYAAYNKDTFRPLEQSIVADAQAYDTPERRQAQAAAASADVEMQLANQRAATQREMDRSGASPSSGKIMAMNGVMDLGAAKLKAGASNKARMDVETIGAAKMADAANMGRNLASNQATSAGIALNQGNSSVANGQVGGNVNAQGNAIMTSGFAGAQSGMAGSGQTYGQIANINAKAGDSSGLFGALGGMAGQYAGSASGSAALTSLFAMSDKTAKTNITPTDPDAALEAIENTPVSNWAYKAGTAANDGGKTHTGPMAQDVQKTMGEKVAPKGKKIDLVSLNGIAMSAIQAVNKKVDKLMAMQGIPMAA